MEGFGGIIAFVAGWFISQVIKIFTEWARMGKMNKKEVFALLVKSRSGGMPSGHSASFVALTTYLGMFEGFGSGVFALAVCMTMIVIYDALNVRRSVGEMGKVMKKERKIKRVVMGHSVPEVIVGGLLGIVVGMGVFWLVCY